MRSSSRQKLQKMHAMLDKQLSQQTKGTNQIFHPPSSQRRKQKSDFNHLRYSSNSYLNNQQQTLEKQSLQQYTLKQKGSYQPIAKRLKQNKQLKQKYSFEEKTKQYRNQQKSFSDDDDDEKQQNKLAQSKGSMRGSRKSQINQLEKKLFDLEKKMENIGITDQQDQQDDDYLAKYKQDRMKNSKQTRLLSSGKTPNQNQNGSKMSLGSLKLKQNNAQSTINPSIYNSNKGKNQGTARFCINQKQKTETHANKVDQNSRVSYLQSNLPLSHRKNTKQQSQSQQEDSDSDYELKYQRFTKINKKANDRNVISLNQSQKNKNKLNKKQHSSSSSFDEGQQRQGNFQQKNNRKFQQNKSISQQIQRLSIVNKPHSILLNKNQQFSSKKNREINHQQKNNSLSKKSDGQKVKINSIPIQINVQRKMTLQTQLLQPKYKLSKQQNQRSDQNIRSIQNIKGNSKRKSQSKNSLKGGLSNKSLSKKKNSIDSHRYKIKVQNQPIINKPSSKRLPITQKQNFRTNSNLNNSFRSQNSLKSKKSIASNKSLKSNKSSSSNHYHNIQFSSSNNINHNHTHVQQKKHIKKIQNLQKQLQHYKRLSKRYQSQLSDYKLIQIQYRKLQNQFKKSQQIRLEQKKIIEAFRNRMVGNG